MCLYDAHVSGYFCSHLLYFTFSGHSGDIIIMFTDLEMSSFFVEITHS